MTRRRSRRSEERRRRLLVSLLKLVLVAGVFGLTGYYAYEAGARVSTGELASMKEELKKAVDQAHLTQEQAEADRAALIVAQQQADQFKALYEQAKPTEELGELTGLLRDKLAAGLSPRRLAIVIRQAENLHGCRNLAGKRVLVHTPHTKGPPGITTLDDTVTLSAEGTGSKGGQEQWFDPEQPVKIHVATRGANKDTELTGRLPIERALATRDSEYHFTISAGARGWLDVATERCEYN
jgi:hypothetical protein